MRHIESIRALILFFVHHVESLGVRRSQLEKTARLKENWLESDAPEELIDAVPTVLRAAQKLIGDDLVCLHAGERFHFCLAGLAGLASTHAPTPVLALETFGRFVGLGEVVNIDTESDDELLTFTANPRSSWPRPTRDQIVDGFSSCLVAALHPLCGFSCPPIRLELQRKEPSRPAEFARVFRCVIEYGAARNAITFSKDQLLQPSKLYDGLLYEQLRFAANLTAKEPCDSGPLRQLVEQTLRNGADTVDEVAKVLRLTSRTLQRRLQTEGATFRKVRGKVRVEMAKELLTTTDLSLAEIARRLQYGDDKALRKATKRETGKTPSELRDESRTP